MKTKFTVLTSRLIHCEYQEYGVFEERPTQWVQNRNFPKVEAEVSKEGDRLILRTEALVLTSENGHLPFSPSTLSIELKNGKKWTYGDTNSDNLGGTYRTLDECDGAINQRENKALQVHPGLFSRSGWSIIDDSSSLVIGYHQLPEKRVDGFVQDFYFFAYGDDFETGLKDFYQLTGQPPLLPAWSLGLWWSRWESYKDEDLLHIVDEFEQHNVPLSTLVIDMDWHIIDNPYHSGWTGYSWNSEYFSDPKGFFETIHNKSIHACLNLHPASGVHPHEDAYPDFAKHMGMAIETQEAIPFNPTDPHFMEGYFKILHHPLEENGVDFWWIDWQQGQKMPFGGADPLWTLNHTHSHDLARSGQKRPLTFSRWCGAGAHRYPIGFSGDTYRTWASLAWEVESTAMASNLGFGWWSHDIGGFARGLHDDELYLRWVQFGILSPIFRLHNAGDPTVDHRPWSKDLRYAKPAIEALQLRRALQPYLYSHAKINSEGGLPLVRPMYYKYCQEENAYRWPGQYMFGENLLAAPITTAAHSETGLVLHPIWLPEGEWFDFKTGIAFKGGRVHAFNATLETLPLFARSGSIIPLQEEHEQCLKLVCFPGTGSTHLYRDDGESMDYLDGSFERWSVSQTLSENQWELNIQQIEGNINGKIKLKVCLRGWKGFYINTLTMNGHECLQNVIVDAQGDLSLDLSEQESTEWHLVGTMSQQNLTRSNPTKQGLTQLISSMPINCHFVRPLIDNWEKLQANPSSMSPYNCDLSDEQFKVIYNYLYDSGVTVTTVSENSYQLSWWNGREDGSCQLQLSRREECAWKNFENHSQNFGSCELSFKSHFHFWRLELHLLGVRTLISHQHTPS